MSPSIQPYWIETPAGRLLEMPDSGAPADYLTTDEMLDHLRAELRRAEHGQRTRFAQVGFHQEGAGDYMPRVVVALQTFAAEHGPQVRFATLRDCADRYRAAPATGRAL